MARKRSVATKISGWFAASIFFTVVALLAIFIWLSSSIPPRNDFPMFGDGYVWNLSNRYAVFNCFEGKYSKDRIMQYDFLKCNMVLVNITPQEFENSSISIYTQSDVEGQKFGEPFPLQEIIKNKNQYEHVFTASEFENNVSTFWLKVPPTSYVAFFFHVPGYFNDISARGATTTQSDEIIRNIIPVLVLLISVFSIFSIVKNVRDLWQNN